MEEPKTIYFGLVIHKNYEGSTLYSDDAEQAASKREVEEKLIKWIRENMDDYMRKDAVINIWRLYPNGGCRYVSEEYYYEVDI